MCPEAERADKHGQCNEAERTDEYGQYDETVRADEYGLYDELDESLLTIPISAELCEDPPGSLVTTEVEKNSDGNSTSTFTTDIDTGEGGVAPLARNSSRRWPRNSVSAACPNTTYGTVMRNERIKHEYVSFTGKGRKRDEFILSCFWFICPPIRKFDRRYPR